MASIENVLADLKLEIVAICWIENSSVLFLSVKLMILITWKINWNLIEKFVDAANSNKRKSDENYRKVSSIDLQSSHPVISLINLILMKSIDCTVDDGVRVRQFVKCIIQKRIEWSEKCVK